MAQLDEKINRFMQAQERAKKIIQMDSNGTLDSYKKNAVKEGKLSYDTNGNANIQPTVNNHNHVPNYASMPMNSSITSKLPKEIVESFKTQPINTSLLSGGMNGGSVLDTINSLSGNQLMKEENNPPRTQIVEQQTTVPTNSNIDYSMIKMIVEDCMRKYTSSLKKSILSEQKESNNNTLQALKIGDKFSFVTNNGDLYEAKLTFVKNIKNKK